MHALSWRGPLIGYAVRRDPVKSSSAVTIAARAVAIEPDCRGSIAILIGEARWLSVYRRCDPVLIDATTSRIAWLEAAASAPEMSESCVAVAMVR